MLLHKTMNEYNNDIKYIFDIYFKIRDQESIKTYKKWNDLYSDEDWTLYQIALKIRKSSEFYDLTKAKKKEYTQKYIINYFIINENYKNNVYNDKNKHALRLKDWRTII